MSDLIVKDLHFGEEGRDLILTGIDKLTKAVSSTLGASGKCVILEDEHGKPMITKDGVTVANSIVLLDPVENMGATLMKQAAQKTVYEAGDGTTTATVLTKAIIDEAYKLGDDSNSRNIKEGITSATKKVVDYLESIVIPVEANNIDQVAKISANNDEEIGKIIGDAFRAVDTTGVVMMETTDNTDTYVDVVDGIQYAQGLKNYHFVTNKESNTAELDEPLVLIVESPIPNIRRIQNVLEYVIKMNRSLLIIAEAEQQVINTLAMNRIKGLLKVNIIDIPVYGITRKEVLADLAALTGATIINEDLGDDIDTFDVSLLGDKCTKAITSMDETILHVTRDSEIIDELIGSVKEEIAKTSNANIRTRLEKRLARLTGKVAVIKVGANSDVELKEKKDRVEDAIHATRAAVKEGIIPGGGVALRDAATLLYGIGSKEERVLYNAILKPYEVILYNAGIDENEYGIVKETGFGYNVITKDIVNMFEAGIIDPLLVTKSALNNAASVASTILSTDCVINNLRVGQ